MLRNEVVEELLALLPEQRGIVLKGLEAKLGLYERRRILSYRYDVCPVCQDVGSTLENPKCDRCYIPLACKEPFNAGFRDDPVKGAAYFEMMRRVLECGRTLVVGGTFDASGGKPSGVVRKLGAELQAEVCNGAGTLADFWVRDFAPYQTIIWMPNVANNAAKVYPRKKPGAVLICSKVMREGSTRFDSVGRIFKMHGNAVIEIREAGGNLFCFTLVDALGTEWCDTIDTAVLAKAVVRFVAWTRGSIRLRTVRVDASPSSMDLEPLVEVTRLVADKVENERGGRFFGNASTRCMAMFPSSRSPSGAFVSARNTDKTRLTAEDFVETCLGEDEVLYLGERKPSVDAPVQLKLYQMFPSIHYMVHGHAFVEGAPTTESYYPCGDLRELDEVAKLMDKWDRGAINLKDHGFLLYAFSAEELWDLVLRSKFGNVVPLPGGDSNLVNTAR